MKARDLLNQHILEDEFKDQVIELATRLGWLVTHQRPAQNKGGKWLTAIQGHKGYPDLTLVKDRRVVWAELKRQKGYPTPEQKRWLAMLETVAEACPMVEVYLWRPSDWDRIKEVLGA